MEICRKTLTGGVLRNSYKGNNTIVIHNEKTHSAKRNVRKEITMKNKESGKCPHMAENAESSVKCKQCGNMVSVSGMSCGEGMVSCPVCGSTVSTWDTLKSEMSNEDY